MEAPHKEGIASRGASVFRHQERLADRVPVRHRDVMNRPVEHYFNVTDEIGDVTGILIRPPEATALYVFGHGAGAGMRHTFMESVVARLAQRRIATFRYQFPYMELGRRAPNRPPVLTATVRAAVSGKSVV